MKSNIRYFLLLLLSTSVIGGLYILGNKLYLPVYLIYLAISTFAICGYMWLVLKHNNEVGIARMNGRELDRELIEKRKTTLKKYIIVFMPFVFSVLIDSIYLVVLKDSPIFSALLNMFQAGNH